MLIILDPWFRKQFVDIKVGVEGENEVSIRFGVYERFGRLILFHFLVPTKRKYFGPLQIEA